MCCSIHKLLLYTWAQTLSRPFQELIAVQVSWYTYLSEAETLSWSYSSFVGPGAYHNSEPMEVQELFSEGVCLPFLFPAICLSPPFHLRSLLVLWTQQQQRGRMSNGKSCIVSLKPPGQSSLFPSLVFTALSSTTCLCFQCCRPSGAASQTEL